VSREETVILGLSLIIIIQKNSIMKKKIISIAFVAAIAVAAAWNFTQSKTEVELSDLALTNVEALASGEGTIKGCCPGGGACVISGVTLLGSYPCQV
jgi:hypothetical protein